MSFGFGTGTTAFGTSANKPTGFGTPFGATSTSTAPTFGFGSNTSASGATGFGTAPATTGFGGFGTTPTTSTFGFGGFGSTPTTTTASVGFGGFGTFGGTATTTSAPAGFGFGATSAAPSSGFSFAAPAPTSGFGGFGSTFGATTGAGLFGNTNTTTTGFGGNFGTKPTTAFGLGSFSFNQPLQTPAQQQQQPADPNAAFYNSIFNVQIFGDERDTILGRWNLIQALWGVGKGFYNHQASPVEYDLKNPFCRFKAIVYNLWSKNENKDGQVALVFNKTESDLRALGPQLVSNLNSVLGNKPNVQVTVEQMRPLNDNKAIAFISVLEKSPTGSARKVPASELAAFLMNPMQKQQLSNLSVENLYPISHPSSEMLREYLENPPPGIDPTVWQQGQSENPAPDRLFPMPLFGFSEVRSRIKNQEYEAGLQLACLNKMSDEINEIQRKLTATEAANIDHKAKLVELQKRLLRVVIKQEKARKVGLILTPEEETMSSQLDALSSLLNSNTFKKKLGDLSENVKTVSNSGKGTPRYEMDPSMVTDLKQFLSMEHTGMNHLISTIQSDLTELKMIKDGLTSMVKNVTKVTTF